MAAPLWPIDSPPVPLMPPLKVVSAVRSMPSVLLPRVTEPAPARLPIPSVLESASVAPLFTVTVPVDEMASPPLTVSVPADTVVPPV